MLLLKFKKSVGVRIMMNDVQNVLCKEVLDYKDIVRLLQVEGEEQKLLFKKAQDVQLNYVGKKGLLQRAGRIFQCMLKELLLLWHKKGKQGS